jgi:flagellin
MVAINTNVPAIIAENALTVNEREMTSAMERLSTGKRINSASDDAAGLAIASRMSSQIAGLNQASRNANDGVSMIQTAESAYVEVSDMLQRMREIAVQSASETYATADRAALDLEFQALQDEIVRISDQTTWNGFNILDGSVGTSGTVKIQSGSNASQTVDVDFGTLARTITTGTVADTSDTVQTVTLGADVAEGDVLTFKINDSGLISAIRWGYGIPGD